MLADDPELAPLWQAVHARLCAGEAANALATVRVAGMSRSGVAALRSWLDTTTRRRRGPSAVRTDTDGTLVPLRELLGVLGLAAEQLQALVERAVGVPVVDRSAAQRLGAGRRERLWEEAAERLPQVPRLLARMRAAGVGADDTDIRRLIDALAAALARIPARPPVPLAKLAHDTAGDPHFFDLDTTAGGRLVAAVAEISGHEQPTRPDRVRALLAGAGVIADRLSATVLLLNVAASGDGPVDRRLREAVAPVALTLLDLLETPPVLCPQQLTIVENPSVLEIALIRGVRKPLACTSGHLRAVDHTLLALAQRCGVTLRYAGDLDGPGLRIATTVAHTYGAELVAMDNATLAEAAVPPSAVPLDAPIFADDLALADGLNAHGRAVFQEHDELLRRVLDQSS
ncbi:TIGR02679 domain-containing protein [Frankia sp. QA3]|uniref:TIGR02679 domain-containing protein n=1 Tax=Frankia sp. QA3 TaxID=710111 RepID=UPI000269C221|nr:TIGR02679 domain-containing protein [Frankia sp. QA3]EIV92597.1 Protein of unknown function (DUF2399)/Protein of unknown function (DUF3323) [Frankia sp. QA3]